MTILFLGNIDGCRQAHEVFIEGDTGLEYSPFPWRSSAAHYASLNEIDGIFRGESQGNDRPYWYSFTAFNQGSAPGDINQLDFISLNPTNAF